MLTTFASVFVKMTVHAVLVSTGLTNSASASADQLKRPLQQANTGTPSTANSNAKSRNAVLENTSELMSLIQITALANAFHMSALMVNTGTPAPAAATASKVTALPTKFGMLLPAIASAWRALPSPASHTSTGTLLNADANVMHQQMAHHASPHTCSTTTTAAVFALILHQLRLPTTQMNGSLSKSATGLQPQDASMNGQKNTGTQKLTNASASTNHAQHHTTGTAQPAFANANPKLDQMVMLNQSELNALKTTHTSGTRNVANANSANVKNAA